MTKYQPLEAHLRKSGQETVSMTFSEIEEVIGAELPASAFKHRGWWSNNPSNSVITHAWLDAGYKSANVDIPGRRLMFRRFEQMNPLAKLGAGPPPNPDFGPPDEAAASGFAEAAGDNIFPVFSRIFGALKGTVTVRPGTDLTAPVDTEWKAGR